MSWTSHAHTDDTNGANSNPHQHNHNTTNNNNKDQDFNNNNYRSNINDQPFSTENDGNGDLFKSKSQRTSPTFGSSLAQICSSLNSLASHQESFQQQQQQQLSSEHRNRNSSCYGFFGQLIEENQRQQQREAFIQPGLTTRDSNQQRHDRSTAASNIRQQRSSIPWSAVQAGGNSVAAANYHLVNRQQNDAFNSPNVGEGNGLQRNISSFNELNRLFCDTSNDNKYLANHNNKHIDTNSSQHFFQATTDSNNNFGKTETKIAGAEHRQQSFNFSSLLNFKSLQYDGEPQHQRQIGSEFRSHQGSSSLLSLSDNQLLQLSNVPSLSSSSFNELRSALIKQQTQPVDAWKNLASAFNQQSTAAFQARPDNESLFSLYSQQQSNNFAADASPLTHFSVNSSQKQLRHEIDNNNNNLHSHQRPNSALYWSPTVGSNNIGEHRFCGLQRNAKNQSFFSQGSTAHAGRSSHFDGSSNQQHNSVGTFASAAATKGISSIISATSLNALSAQQQQDADNERYSRKVFVGGLPPDIDEDEIRASFSRFGRLSVDWPHKAESKSYFPPKGYAFLLFQEEASVMSLIDTCIRQNDKLYLCVSSPTTKDKLVQIRPWKLTDANCVLNSSSILDPRRTVFVGGVPRPLKASELAQLMNELYSNVCYAGIDVDPDLKYPKGAGRVAFSTQESYIAAISYRFVQLRHSEFEKRIEVKPYVLDDQVCEECKGARTANKFAPFFCANISCLRYYCEQCWSIVHANSDDPSKRLHKPLVKEGVERSHNSSNNHNNGHNSLASSSSQHNHNHNHQPHHQHHNHSQQQYRVANNNSYHQRL